MSSSRDDDEQRLLQMSPDDDELPSLIVSSSLSRGQGDVPGRRILAQDDFLDENDQLSMIVKIESEDKKMNRFARLVLFLIGMISGVLFLVFAMLLNEGIADLLNFSPFAANLLVSLGFIAMSFRVLLGRRNTIDRARMGDVEARRRFEKESGRTEGIPTVPEKSDWTLILLIVAGVISFANSYIWIRKYMEVLPDSPSESTTVSLGGWTFEGRGWALIFPMFLPAFLAATEFVLRVFVRSAKDVSTLYSKRYHFKKC